MIYTPLQRVQDGNINMSEEDTKTSERRAFILLVVFLAPVLAVAIVGGYGFAVWFSQLAFFGAPGPS